MKEFKCDACNHDVIIEISTGATCRSPIEEICMHGGKLKKLYGRAEYGLENCDHIWYECAKCGRGVTKEELEALCEDSGKSFTTWQYFDSRQFRMNNLGEASVFNKLLRDFLKSIKGQCPEGNFEAYKIDGDTWGIWGIAMEDWPNSTVFDSWFDKLMEKYNVEVID